MEFWQEIYVLDAAFDLCDGTCEKVLLVDYLSEGEGVMDQIIQISYANQAMKFQSKAISIICLMAYISHFKPQ